MEMVMNEWERRTTPFNGIGIDVSDCQSIGEVLYRTNLDFDVNTRPVYDIYGREIPRFRAVTRTDTGDVFGITKENYRPVQNREAFAFVDDLLKQGASFDKAGAYKCGLLSWVQMKMPPMMVEGEEYKPYIFLTAGHNGKTGNIAAMGTIRAICCNMAKTVWANANYKVSITHKGDVQGKMTEARKVMAHADNYLEGFKRACYELKGRPLSKDKVKVMIDSLFPIDEQMEETKVENIQRKRERLSYIYLQAPDLQNEPDNGYRFLNAVSDYESHTEPGHQVTGWRENRMLRLTTAPSLTDKAYEMVMD